MVVRIAFEKACSCVTEKNVFVARSICLNQDSMFKKSATIREPLFQYLNKNVQNNYFFFVARNVNFKTNFFLNQESIYCFAFVCNDLIDI